MMGCFTFSGQVPDRFLIGFEQVPDRFQTDSTQVPDRHMLGAASCTVQLQVHLFCELYRLRTDMASWLRSC